MTDTLIESNNIPLAGKKIVIYTPALDLRSGGIVVLHNLAKELIELSNNNFKVALFSMTKNKVTYPNDFCHNFATANDIDNDTIIIYPEIVRGNPLNAKNVVRWILCEPGVHCDKNIYQSWNDNDLVFHYAPFNKTPCDVELLYTLWLNPKIENKNLPRSGSCHLFRKMGKFHKNITYMHPTDSVCIDKCSIDEIIEIFNKKVYFFCYDPYSFYESMAALCGCIPIVYPIEGMSKLDWLKTKGMFQVYLDKRDNISGIGYGMNDFIYAATTIQNVPNEKLDAINFGRETIVNFTKKVDAYFFKNDRTYNFRTVRSIFNQ